MLSKIITRLHTPFGRYVIIGVSVYALELIIIFTSQTLGASALMAVSLSYWIGLVLSFFLQKLVTFNDKRMHRHILIPQLIAVSILVLFNYGFTLLITKLLIHIVPVAASRTVALGITTLWNFYLYKTHIFKSDTILID